MSVPTVTSELLGHVKNVMAREWRVMPESIPDTAALNRYEHWDSLGHITLLLALETEFGVEISADTVQALSSIPKIVQYLQVLADPVGNKT